MSRLVTLMAASVIFFAAAAVPLPAAVSAAEAYMMLCPEKDCIGGASCTPNRQCLVCGQFCYAVSPGDPPGENPNGDDCGCL